MTTDAPAEPSEPPVTPATHRTLAKRLRARFTSTTALVTWLADRDARLAGWVFARLLAEARDTLRGRLEARDFRLVGLAPTMLARYAHHPLLAHRDKIGGLACRVRKRAEVEKRDPQALELVARASTTPPARAEEMRPLAVAALLGATESALLVCVEAHKHASNNASNAVELLLGACVSERSGPLSEQLEQINTQWLAVALGAVQRYPGELPWVTRTPKRA